MENQLQNEIDALNLDKRGFTPKQKAFFLSNYKILRSQGYSEESANEMAVRQILKLGGKLTNQLKKQEFGH